MPLFELKGSENYATIIEIYDTSKEVPLRGRDRIIGYRTQGGQAIIGKNQYANSDLIIVFPAECQLSDVYARANNLYRHSNLNADSTKSGYLEDSRRVKALKMGEHHSTMLIMPLRSLTAGITGNYEQTMREVKPGLIFDYYNGQEICRKYVIEYEQFGNKNTISKTASRKYGPQLGARDFPLHFDTTNGWRNLHRLNPDDMVWLSQKLHGSSVRAGNIMVDRDLNWWQRIAAKLGLIKRTEYRTVVGSRTVIKGFNGQPANSRDWWTPAVAHMLPTIPPGYMMYGEIIGWTPSGAPIQKDYTYQIPKGENRVYVYRVTRRDSLNWVDLTWPEIEQFCASRDWNVVPSLTTEPLKMREAQHLIDNLVLGNKRYRDEGYQQALPLAPGLPDEGIVVRRDNYQQTPLVLKFKSPAFLTHETISLDSGQADYESVA